MLSRLPSRRLLSTAAAASPTSHKPHNLSPTPKSRPPKINHVFPPSPSDIASHIPISNYFDENLLRLRAEAAHRRLSEKGTKPEVVERLEKHDAHRGASPYLHNKMRIVRNKLSPKALRRTGKFVAKQEPSPYKLGRNMNNKREFSTAVAIDVTLPPMLPKLWEDDVSTAAPPPIRVPFLPDNDFARYHRREYVPTVAPPHKPIVSTADEDSSSVKVGFGVSELIADPFPQREMGGEEREVEGIIAPRDDDEGEPMTKKKEDALKTFAVLAGAWWFFGEGVMRALGVI